MACPEVQTEVEASSSQYLRPASCGPVPSLSGDPATWRGVSGPPVVRLVAPSTGDVMHHEWVDPDTASLLTGPSGIQSLAALIFWFLFSNFSK